MNFIIADTFTDSLARLTDDEQKAIKTTAFDLQLNPASPGMSFHKLDRARDKNFWSVRVNNDIRLIVHKSEGSLLLCYVNHHDKAYQWAERRKLETHPKTGAAQLVEIRERVQEVVIPTYTYQAEPTAPTKKTPAKAILGAVAEEELLGYGVPQEWLCDVREADEDGLLRLAERLPAEAAEAILELATGGRPRPKPKPETTDPFKHPDAQRRFRLMSDIEELERALEFPWDKWSTFLHPEQRGFVEKKYTGPARVTGSAGTGKTIVALHRAVYLAKENPEARVLLTTFSDVLASALREKLRRLIGNQPRLAERLEVTSLPALGARLFRIHCGAAEIATTDFIAVSLTKAAQTVKGHKFSPGFLRSEWEHVVDPWQVSSWEGYREVQRLGRKTRLSESQRKLLWQIFELTRSELAAAQRITISGQFSQLAAALEKLGHPPFEYMVVDEAQDLGVAHLRFLVSMARHSESLFFAGDQGQRIFQQAFSWKALGIDLRGRSRNLRVNYRTSHQIRSRADQLLDPTVADADGNSDNRDDTVSVFNGPAPEIEILNSSEAEMDRIATWLEAHSKAGTALGEIAVFVRSSGEIERAAKAVQRAKLEHRIIDETVSLNHKQVSICAMHLAKGLEFKCVVVMACDEDVLPLKARIESVGDESDLKEVYDTERHLLYVACTRARDHLIITAVAPGSEFLADMADWGAK